jgi:2-desacetyl-2-hydroxyethyl bacteriochlorophyllide A dehydrogenase
VNIETSPGGALEARAVWFTAPRTAELRPEIVPPPSPGEVRVRSVASAISHGTEMLVYRGEVPEGTALDLPTLAGDFSFPIKHGYATVGRILDTGPGVEHLRPKDLVFAHHPHQEIFTVSADLPVRLPEVVDATTGLFFANLETALNVVHDAPLHLGETALVFGQGVVGLLLTQLLKLAGADRVLVVEPIKGRRRLALEVGADAAFEPGEDLRERVMEVTGERGADLAVEASSSGAALQAAVDAVAVEGTVVVASWYGAKPVTLSLGGHFHRGRVKMRSSQVGRVNPELGPRWDRARRTEAVLDLLPRLRLKELVSHMIPFEEALRAYRLVDEEPGETVQVILFHDHPNTGPSGLAL